MVSAEEQAKSGRRGETARSNDRSSNLPRSAAFAGLGQMGRAMAAHLPGIGLDVIGVDPDEKGRAAAEGLGITTVARLADANGVEAVFACVPGPSEVAVVVGECLSLPVRPRFFINMSTIGAQASREQCDRLRQAEKPIAYVESPISGGVLRAARKEATLLWAAEPDSAAPGIQSIIEQMANRVISLPTIAAASAAKLANNLAMLATSLGTLEAFEWAMAKGLPLESLFESFAAGTADSYALRSTLARSIRDGDFERGFAMRLALKDVRLILREAAESGIDMPFAQEIERQLQAGCDAGLADQTFPAIAALSGIRAGTAIPADTSQEVRR